MINAMLFWNDLPKLQKIPYKLDELKQFIQEIHKEHKVPSIDFSSDDEMQVIKV